MKIFLDGHFLDGQKHGVAIYLEELYLHLMKTRKDIVLFVGLERGGSIHSPLFSLDNVHLVEYKLGGWWRFIFDIPLLTRKIAPDFVHTQNALPVFRGFARYHVTLFDVLYEDFPSYFGKGYRITRSFFFRMAAHKASILSTCSEYSARRIPEHYFKGERFKKKIVKVITPGIAPSSIANISVQESVEFKFLLYVSRFEARKNHLTLIKSFDIALKTHPALKLTLVGFEIDGSLDAAIALVRDLNIVDSVIFESNISSNRLDMLYRNASIVIYPSLCEGFGMPILEAMLVNPCVMFSDTSAMSDFTFASECFVDPSSIEAMSEKILDCLSDPILLHKNYSFRQEFIRKNYLWSQSGDALGEIYR